MHHTFYFFLLTKSRFRSGYFVYRFSLHFLVKAMDSGNSGSMQSSSGGDEDYDDSSRSVDQNNLLPNFFNSSISNTPTFFYPNSSQNNNLELFSHSQSNPNPSLYNQDFWFKNMRSNDEQNYQTVQSSPPLAPPPSSQSLIGSQGQTRPFTSSSSQLQQPEIVKNPKKRTRASRRAPTTVLQTDTANFRQMVQEFTGIPAAPFSAATPYSRRLDLFGGAATLGGSLYPLRPSAQKVVQPSLPPYNISSNMVDSSLANNTSTISNVASTSNNYTNSHTMLQNPILTSFQSLLQSQNESTTFAGRAKSSNQENSRNIHIPSLDNLGMSNQHVNANISGFPSHESSNGTQEEHFGSFNLQNVQSVVDKGMENASSRGQGTVDSWNFPSD